jgi:hypothetical protein
MKSGSITLGDVSDRSAERSLAFNCKVCGRSGSRNLDKLIEEHGPDFSIPELLRLVSADCPKRSGTGQIHDVCGAHCPGLPALFMARDLLSPAS